MDAGGGAHGRGARVLVVEGHELLAQALTAAFRADRIEAAFAPDRSYEGVLQTAKGIQPSVVLLGLDAVEGSTFPLVEQLRDLGASVVMVSGRDDTARWGPCLEAGALAVVSTASTYEHVVVTMSEVLTMRSLVSREDSGKLLSRVRRRNAEQRQAGELHTRPTPRDEDLLLQLLDGSRATLPIASAAAPAVSPGRPRTLTRRFAAAAATLARRLRRQRHGG